MVAPTSAAWTSLTAAKKVQKYADGVLCLGDGCTKRPHSRGYCSTHAWRIKKYGSPDIAAPRTPNAGRDCSLPECSEPAKLYGLCAEHSRPVWNTLSRHHSAVRRGRRANAHVYPYSRQSVDDRMAYFGFRCWMCSGPFEVVDHVKPLSKGGLDCPANMRPACRSCNCRKRDKWLGNDALSHFAMTK